MPENNDPFLGRDELMDLIGAQIAASETAASVAEVAAKLSPDATLLVAEIENDLVTAERFSKPRSSLGRAKIPGKNTAVERLLLRLHALLFRDQRNTDAALIAALRKSLQLNIRLAAEYATLLERGPVSQLESDDNSK